MPRVVKPKACRLGMWRGQCTVAQCSSAPPSAGCNPELVHFKPLGWVAWVQQWAAGGQSVDEAHAERGDCQSLQDSPGRDDAVPVVLQCAGVGRCLVFVGGGGECAVIGALMRR
jgi:hypothetical protein